MRHENPYLWQGFVEVPASARQKMHSVTARIVAGAGGVDPRWGLSDGDQVMLSSMVTRRIEFEGEQRHVDLQNNNLHLMAAVDDQYTDSGGMYPRPPADRIVTYTLYVVSPTHLMAKLDHVEGVEDLGEHYARLRTHSPAAEVARLGKSDSLTVR